MAAKENARATAAAAELRVAEFARIIAAGGRRSDCIKFATENWGIKADACARYLSMARDQLRADWDIERPQMIADLLSQCATLQQEARAAGHLHIALGAINTAARLAQIVS